MPVTGRLPCQPDGIKFTQCVSDQKLVFSPLQENYALDRKVTHTLLRRSLSAFKIWGDRTARASCRSENCCFFHAWSACAWGNRSNKYCVTAYGSILMRFTELVSE